MGATLTNQQLRRDILLQLYASRPCSLTAASMERTSRRNGEYVSASDYLREADYLVKSGLATKTLDAATGEPRFEITRAGMDAYENAA